MDRLAQLLSASNTTLNGIDFVEITTADQTDLLVHFLNAVPVPLIGAHPVSITGGESVPSVPVKEPGPGSWSVDGDGRPLLALTVAHPGDFSFYTLSIASPALDPMYSSVAFSFKANCPSDLDCEPPPPLCPPSTRMAPTIDYLAKDFSSFRQALSDFSARSYPGWVERSEADLGMMVMELLASVADDLSYQQDRVAAEVSIHTATERRSLVRLARLVDYEPSPMLSAGALVQVDVASGPIPAGAVVTAAGASGAPVSFELSSGLIDASTGELNKDLLAVDSRWNAKDQAGNWRILPYWWDDRRRCLPAGAAEMWVYGHGYAFPTGDASRDIPGLALLIETTSASPLDAPTREVIHLSAAIEEHDDLFGHDVTHLSWPASEGLAGEHDLTRTHLAGNLVPATEGRRHTERFVIDPPAFTAAGPTAAVVRTGANASCEDPAPMYLHTLSQGRLAWLPAGAGGAPMPEIHLTGQGATPGDAARTWRWRRRLLEAVEFEEAFTTDPARYVDLAAGSSGVPLWEYDGDGADSICFGDDDFGQRPLAGTVFEVTYRVGSGAAGNVAADTITGFDPAMAGAITSATNPFPASGGADPEPATQIRRLAPYAFRALQYRAVRAGDYAAAARSLPWVLDAGTVFRWTGSWLSVFTTADPQGTEQIPVAEHVQLIDLLNRRRLAGYESFTPAPHYVAVDLRVTVCAIPSAFRGEVEAAILVELGTGLGADGHPAFFSLDRFHLGTALERSALEAAIQGANGIEGVLSILYRWRGLVGEFEPMPEVVSVGANDVLRVDNDPSRPERGSLQVKVEGGK